MGGEVVSVLPGGGTTLAASFIDAGAADVPHPFDDIVVTVVELGLKHLQVAHLQAGWSKRNLQGQGRNVKMCQSMQGGVGCGFLWQEVHMDVDTVSSFARQLQ